jgi:hypothetical protein
MSDLEHVILQTDYNWDWLNTNMYELKVGFESDDYKVIKARDKYDLEEILKDKQAIVCGEVNFVQNGMRLQDIDVPEPIDYPDWLSEFIDRDIEKKDIANIDFPAFVKPVKHKDFVGDVFLCADEFYSYHRQNSGKQVWVSEQVHFVSEFRIYIDHTCDEGSVLDMKQYCGSWYLKPTGKKLLDIADRANYAFKQGWTPHAYSIDVGLKENWDVSIVEVNDAYALGNYGLEPLKYSRMVENRWEELKG